MKYVCEKCKGSNIETKAWININTEEVISFTSDGEKEDNWCNHCKEHVFLNYVDDEEDLQLKLDL